MIEKRLTQELLEAGRLTLTARERGELGLPEHSTTIEMELESERFGAQWSGRSRQLSGDTFTERLTDYGQVGGLLRLRRVDQTFRLLLLPPGSQMQVNQELRPPQNPPKPPPGSKAARRRATVDRQFHSDDKYDWGSGTARTIGFLTEARSVLGEQLNAAGFDPLDMVELRLQGEELATLDDFEELLAVDVANVDRMPHQAAAARHALSRLRGRAIFADEVGLGKTIEAGLAIKELTLRGLARRVLILCPAPLRDQWREEMNQKFDLPFDVAYRSPDIGDQDKLIISLSLAKYNNRNFAKITDKPWDIVIVDEAHRAAGASAHKTRELVTALTTACRYAFFLTATPVQNSLLELYRLVELLRPGTFKSKRAFEREFMASYDSRTPRDPAALRRLISSAMIRTTRAQAGVDRVIRRAIDVPIDLGTRERELYALSTDLLRNVMQDPGDAMRRRSLALRLTASPFSMGTTALRMAERHQDSRVRKVLTEIGHLAMDITDSAREDAALQITGDWMRDHGRVLIFTQHTDTVTGLLRRMAAEGLNARSFHGSMSPSERAATIAAFRSGEAPIMISTDAGAEGQNLQFCNCVLNYDLPWNPMRIEQRIGRVDRLTQPRDEVFIANLYARNTIDQSVYQLLAEKLRMFELLFGQVTTILGELDDSKSATFESRVLDALFATSDAKMDSLLAELGTELAGARKRASTLIAADGDLSSWMAAATEHRKGLTKAGSAELAPEVRERARIRQRRVQAWVRRVLDALGAEIVHDTGDGDGAFLTVRFDDELKEDLGGRTLLHLAFDRHGLEHHPDAELCAVGSPIFDELLGLLRMRGDMHATVPVIPADLGPSPFRHSPTITLARRRLIPSGTWRGNATFRATVGEAETSEHIITVEVGSGKPLRLPRRPLADGEQLPASFGQPRAVISAFEAAAAQRLEELRISRTKEIEVQQAHELARIQAGYTAQIEEAPYDDVARLKRALESEKSRLDRKPDVRARAKLLALTLDEGDWLVEETWTGPNGSEATLTYEWGLDQPPKIESDASDKRISVLTLCSDGHRVDASEVTQCGSCGSDLCGACGADAVFADCTVCGIACCARCRATTGGICGPCSVPARAPELDTEFAVGWRVNRGMVLLVGERVAELVVPGQSAPVRVVPDEDVADPARIRMRSYALSNGLPADCGLVRRELTIRAESRAQIGLPIRTSTAIEIEISLRGGTGSSIDSTAIADLPQGGHAMVSGEGELKVAGLLSRLRDAARPPTPPTVVATHRSRFVDFYLEAHRLVEQTSVVADDGSLEIVSQEESALRWRDPSIYDATLADGQLSGLRVVLERRNEAVLISASEADCDATKQWIALPNGTTASDQLGWFEVLRSRNAPGGRVGRPPTEQSAMTGSFPSPTDSTLVSRDTHPVVEVTEVESGSELVSATTAPPVALIGTQTAPVETDHIATISPPLSQTLLDRSARSFTNVVKCGLEVHETWRGHGTATHLYRTFDGQPAAPTLDDIGVPGADFGICRDGHFYQSNTASLCVSCQTWACRACDEIDHRASINCETCTAPVCRRCLSTPHSVPAERCLLCSDGACESCGRDPQVRACVICDRQMCSSCRADDMCRACSQMTLVSDTQLHDLPTTLAAIGAVVVAGCDNDATTVLVNRGDVLEQAVIRRGSIDRWVLFGRSESDDFYRLRLAASRKLGAQVIPVVEPLDPENPIEEPHVVAESKRWFVPSWSVTELDLSSQCANKFDTADDDLARLVEEDFPPLPALPANVVSTPNQVGQLFEALPPPRTADLILRWHRNGYDTVITASGIRHRTFDGLPAAETAIPWMEVRTGPSWATEAWNPVPFTRLHAAHGAVEAAIVSIASMLALGVQTPDGIRWYSISASPDAIAATGLARSMGAGDADAVGAFVDPASIVYSSVLNASHISRNVHPIGTVQPQEGHTPREITADALKAWLPDAELRSPELGALPDALVRSLQQLLPLAQTQTVLQISAHVEELATVADGLVWQHQTTLSPGQYDARRVDAVARVPRQEGIIDREGHFGAEPAHCAYCTDRVCAHCVDRLVTCDCCTAPICRRCARESHTNLLVCPACLSLRPPTRAEARQYGRLLLTRGMLIGSDSEHVVVFERAKGRWQLHTECGKRPVVNPSVSNFLDEH